MCYSGSMPDKSANIELAIHLLFYNIKHYVVKNFILNQVKFWLFIEFFNDFFHLKTWLLYFYTPPTAFWEKAACSHADDSQSNGR